MARYQQAVSNQGNQNNEGQGSHTVTESDIIRQLVEQSDTTSKYKYKTKGHYNNLSTVD